MKGVLKRFSIIPLAMLLASGVLVTQTKDLERSIKNDVRSQEADIVPIAFQGLIVEQVTVDPHNPAVVYAGVWGKGLYKSLDFGGSWKLIRECHRFSYLNLNQILVDPVNPNTLYWNDSEKYNLQKSTDGGSTWFEIYETSVDILVMDPKNPEELYASCKYGIIKSTDGGKKWENILHITEYVMTKFNGFSGLLIDPDSTDTVYAFYYEGYGDTGRPKGYLERVFKSFDGGLHWNEIFRPPYPDFSPYLYFTSRPVMSPCNYSVFYAGVQGRFGASYDGGYSWFRIADLSVGRLFVHPSDCRRLYAGSRGLWSSDDEGVNWRFLGLNGKAVNQIVIDPRSEEKPDRIYIATNKGLFGIGSFQPQPCIDLIEPKSNAILSGTVTIKARISSTVKLKQVEFFVDDKKIGEANPSDLSEDIYTCDWDTRQYGIDTEHLVKVKAVNEQGYAGEYETFFGYTVKNVTLKAKAEEIQERSWLMRKRCVKLTVNTENPYHAAIDRYILYRDTSGNEGELKTYNARDVSNGTFAWFEPFVAGKRYWYRAEARDAKNTLLAVVQSDSKF